MHRNARLSTHCIPLYLRGQRVQSVYDDFPASSYAAYIRETPFAMTSFLTNARLHPNNRVAAVIVPHPGSAAGLLGAMLHGTIWNR